MIPLHSLLNERYQQLIHTRVPFNLVNKKEVKEGILYEFNVPSLTSNNSYLTQIVLENERPTLNTKCLVRCDCDSFLYSYMVRLYRYKGLYGRRPLVNTLPKHGTLELTGCKHLAIIAHELLFNYEKYKL